MTNNKTLTPSSTTIDAGPDAQPAAVTPQQLIAQLRAIRVTLTALNSVAAADKKRLVKRGSISGDVLQAQINLISVSNEIPTVLGTPAAGVQGLADTFGEWSDVEDELRIILDAVETHNLVTRDELHSLTSRATLIGAQLARDPKKASVYGTHLQEIRRLKRLGRRRKAATPQQAPDSPAPSEKQ